MWCVAAALAPIGMGTINNYFNNDITASELTLNCAGFFSIHPSSSKEKPMDLLPVVFETNWINWLSVSWLRSIWTIFQYKTPPQEPNQNMARGFSFPFPFIFHRQTDSLNEWRIKNWRLLCLSVAYILFHRTYFFLICLVMLHKMYSRATKSCKFDRIMKNYRSFQPESLLCSSWRSASRLLTESSGCVGSIT